MKPFPRSPNEPANPRTASFPVEKLILDRWSPRAFSSEPVPEEALMTLVEAARWSPSCFIEQPWLFVLAASAEERAKMLTILAEGNRAWAKNAPVLAILFAKRRFSEENQPNRWAGFDCGAAWMSLTFQARLLGLHTHAMGGFDVKLAYETLNVPEADYEAVCAIAIGRYGDPAGLPEAIRSREKPNTERKTATEISVRAIR